MGVVGVTACAARQVEPVRANLDDIRGRQEAIIQLHDRSKTLVRRQDVQAAQQQLQTAIDEVRQVALRTKAQLDALEAANAEAVKVRGQERGSANERTRTSVTAGARGARGRPGA